MSLLGLWETPCSVGVCLGTGEYCSAVTVNGIAASLRICNGQPLGLALIWRDTMGDGTCAFW